MNILFLTLVNIDSIYESGVTVDLIRQLDKLGNNVYVISPLERRMGKKTYCVKESNTRILRLRTGNVFKTNVIEKGITTVLIELQYKNAIKKNFKHISFDLIVYGTPPITLVGAIKYAKMRDNAKTYLVLKDIFPQNAVDIGMMKKTGVKGILYKYFRRKERELYRISDRIGCMSNANVKYLLNNNRFLNSNDVEILPNSIELSDKSVDGITRDKIRKKYDIPLEKKVFLYGGNLGKPQGIPFLIECLSACRDLDKIYFLIIGNGTEYHLLKQYTGEANQDNVRIFNMMPKEDYLSVVGACDVGLIFLDYRFTIPNYPSRLLSYMQARLPVLACTDSNTDIGDTIVNGDFGWWCESNDVRGFVECVNEATGSDLKQLGDNAYKYLEEHYDVRDAARTILNMSQ